MPILHFSGRFRFQLPYFNNNPKNDARKKNAYDLQPENKNLKVGFNSELGQDEVHERLLCDPTRYFEFEFSNVRVTRITYDDGSNNHDTKNSIDPIIGKIVLLKGMLIDLAPHLQRGQLNAGKIRITDTLIGRIKKTRQSNVQKNIRVSELQKNNSFHYSAYFEAGLYEVFRLADPYVIDNNSRYLRELNNLELKIFLSLCRYDISINEGEVYGYLTCSFPSITTEGLLIRNRKLSIDRSLFTSKKYQELITDFKITLQEEKTYPRATFEILENKYQSLLILRYTEIMPFIDYDNNTPNYKCYILLSNKKFNAPTEELILDCSYEEMRKAGGIKVIKLSEGQLRNLGTLDIAIAIKKNDAPLRKLLIEPIWNIILDEDECIKMYSNERIQLTGKIFKENKLYLEDKNLVLETNPDPNSPLVAWFEKKELTTVGGKFKVEIVSRNLENSELVPDPVTNKKIKGDLPWDRYYGNSLSIQFKTVEGQAAAIEIMARVIHTFEKSKVPTIEDIKKLFSYYARYYPWLHVRVNDCNYVQFLDFNVNDLIDLLRENGSSIKTRLIDLKDDDWYKMPRSRDFPKNGDIAISKLSFRK